MEVEPDRPFRYGVIHKVNYDLHNSGTWYELPDGDRLWKLNVVCPDALSVNFLYDKFWIPDGGKLFIYTTDHKHSIGAFTSRNNKGNNINVRGFATGLLPGSEVTLEYYQPKEVTSDAIISIESVVHGYRDIDIESNIDVLESCYININCIEGRSWQFEKKATALVLMSDYSGSYSYTGSLINTTDMSQKPFFLTACHNIEPYYDAESNPSIIQSIFYWNYESLGCDTTSIVPALFSTSGAIVLANNNNSDFALLRLTEDPKDILGYSPYYLGWDCTGESGEAGVCIHHPNGDTKKISTVSSQPLSADYQSYYIHDSGNHWLVTFATTQNGNGTVEQGSSGSALLNSEHRVIGQLHGGFANCNTPNASEWFGKLSCSWIGSGYYTYNIYRRLDCWLDSIGTGQTTLEGLMAVSDTCTINIDEQIYGNIRITHSGQLTITSNVVMRGNSRVIVEAGGKLIIDGGTLSNVCLGLKKDATLLITHNGKVESRDQFRTPIGAIVNIQHGTIR